MAQVINLIKVASEYYIEKELLKPLDENIPDMVTKYKEEVENNANTHAKENDFEPYKPNFYRDTVNPENFYSSIDNRKRLELIFLKKGIEILNNSNVSIPNIRPLGFSLSSYKDFGFGALIFTWRNVPNNTPIVFWYNAGSFFTPLFKKKDRDIVSEVLFYKS